MTSVSGRHVVVTNLGDGSNTSDGLVDFCGTLKTDREAVAAADVVVVIVGGNDEIRSAAIRQEPVRRSSRLAKCLAASCAELVEQISTHSDRDRGTPRRPPHGNPCGKSDYEPVRRLVTGALAELRTDILCRSPRPKPQPRVERPLLMAPCALTCSTRSTARTARTTQRSSWPAIMPIPATPVSSRIVDEISRLGFPSSAYDGTTPLRTRRRRSVQVVERSRGSDL